MSGLAATFAVVMLGVHFVHLRADFPNNSPWMDYAKYTDEGWYGNAAISWFLRGHWYVPGDFNPAVALPVWPLLEWVLFCFTGVSVAAARGLSVAVFGGALVATYFLVRGERGRWPALLAVTLLAANAYLYCFVRLAILEPLMILLMLLTWLAVLRASGGAGKREQLGWYVIAGVLTFLMVLTKTTSIFLLPAVLYLLWHREGRSIQHGLRKGTVLAGSAALLFGCYYFLGVKPHYLDDYHYLFAANIYPKPTSVLGWLQTFWRTISAITWIDGRLAGIFAVLLVCSVVWIRGVWRKPLFIASFLAGASYLFFIGLHNNVQPRYYEVIAFQLAIMVSLMVDELLRMRRRIHLALAALAVYALVVVLVSNSSQVVSFATHPTYTLVDAARNLTGYVDRHPHGRRLLLSISGSEIELITGLPGICDDFGTMDLPTRIATYDPGWYAAWNEVDAETLRDLNTRYRLEEAARFPALDDPDRNLLILYRLVPNRSVFLAAKN